MIWLAAGAGGGLVVGALAAWLLGRRKPNADTQDWKTRIAARDQDLHAAEEARAEAVAELEAAKTEIRRLKVQVIEADTRSADLESRSALDEAVPIPPDTLSTVTDVETAPVPVSELSGLHQQIDALERELAEAEEELVSLRAGTEEGAGADSPGRSRIEELESELATLDSLRCPDPAAHRPQDTAEPGSQADR